MTFQCHDCSHADSVRWVLVVCVFHYPISVLEPFHIHQLRESTSKKQRSSSAWGIRVFTWIIVTSAYREQELMCKRSRYYMFNYITLLQTMGCFWADWTAQTINTGIFAVLGNSILMWAFKLRLTFDKSVYISCFYSFTFNLGHKVIWLYILNAFQFHLLTIYWPHHHHHHHHLM